MTVVYPFAILKEYHHIKKKKKKEIRWSKSTVLPCLVSQLCVRLFATP